MRLFAIWTILSIGIGAGAFPYPESISLHGCHGPGSTEYGCYANCGGVIVASGSDGYCASNTFQPELKNCVNCALEHEIRQYSGDSMSKAATACGLEANPVQVASAVGKTTSATIEPRVGDQGANDGSAAISSTKAEATASLTARSLSQPPSSPYSTAKSNMTSTGTLLLVGIFANGASSYSVGWSALNVMAGVLVAAMFW